MSGLPNQQSTAPTAPAPTEPPKPQEGQVLDVPSMEGGKKPDDMSAKFAALAKRERINRKLQMEAKQREAQLAERERLIAERERQWEEEFKTNPLEALKKRGRTYQDLTQAALNDGKFAPETEIKSVKEELARIRQEQEEKEKKQLEAQTEAQAKAEQEAVTRFKSSITETIEAKKDTFELTHLYEQSELVFQTIEEHYKRTAAEGKPKILSIEEGCELVEKYLESEFERAATTSKKFKEKFLTQKETDKTERPKTTTTISNSMQPTSSAPTLLPKQTEDDRIKRALAALG